MPIMAKAAVVMLPPLLRAVDASVLLIFRRFCHRIAVRWSCNVQHVVGLATGRCWRSAAHCHPLLRIASSAPVKGEPGAAILLARHARWGASICYFVVALFLFRIYTLIIDVDEREVINDPYWNPEAKKD